MTYEREIIERFGCTYILAPGMIPDGHIVTDGGWVVPRPATRDDVNEAMREGTAELRQELERLRAEVLTTRATAAAPDDRVIVGEGAAQPALLDVKACAALLGVSVRSWQRMVERGEAPHALKIGKSARWRRSDIEAFIASLR
jgi:predicted DNA-binding transcriptional regulator AlpA